MKKLNILLIISCLLLGLSVNAQKEGKIFQSGMVATTYDNLIGYTVQPVVRNQSSNNLIAPGTVNITFQKNTITVKDKANNSTYVFRILSIDQEGIDDQEGTMITAIVDSKVKDEDGYMIQIELRDNTLYSVGLYIGSLSSKGIYHIKHEQWD